MAKCSSDQEVAYPEVNVHVRDLVHVVGIVASFAPRGCRQQRFAKGEKPGVQDYGGRHVAKRSSDSRVAYPGQSSGTGPSTGCGIVTPFALRGVSIRVEFVLSSPRG